MKSVPGDLILGIESSCDETSAAVVRGGQTVLSNVVASQLVHADYGGVVPELASREHLRNIVPVVRSAMAKAGVAYRDLSAVAVTEGPGLAGALLVGITFAKALAYGSDLPLIAVNHLEGHIHAVLMNVRPSFDERSPLLALVVSGGHTHLYLATRAEAGTWRYRNVGKTLDDAAGEAYDKVAKLLGLPYPGGPWIDALAAYGDARAVPFSLAQIKVKASGRVAPKSAALTKSASLNASAQEVLALEMDASFGRSNGDRTISEDDPTRFDFSFSGIKTAVRRYVEVRGMLERVRTRESALRAAGLHTGKPSNPEQLIAALAHLDRETLDLIASFQASMVAYLTRQTYKASAYFGAGGVLVSGGVSANSLLRERMASVAAANHLPIAFPTVALSTDNAAMIAAAAWPKLLTRHFAPDTLQPTPQLRLG